MIENESRDRQNEAPQATDGKTENAAMSVLDEIQEAAKKPGASPLLKVMAQAAKNVQQKGE